MQERARTLVSALLASGFMSDSLHALVIAVVSVLATLAVSARR